VYREAQDGAPPRTVVPDESPEAGSSMAFTCPPDAFHLRVGFEEAGDFRGGSAHLARKLFPSDQLPAETIEVPSAGRDPAAGNAREKVLRPRAFRMDG